MLGHVLVLLLLLRLLLLPLLRRRLPVHHRLLLHLLRLLLLAHHGLWWLLLWALLLLLRLRLLLAHLLLLLLHRSLRSLLHTWLRRLLLRFCRLCTRDGIRASAVRRERYSAAGRQLRAVPMHGRTPVRAAASTHAMHPAKHTSGLRHHIWLLRVGRVGLGVRGVSVGIGLLRRRRAGRGRLARAGRRTAVEDRGGVGAAGGCHGGVRARRGGGLVAGRFRASAREAHARTRTKRSLVDGPPVVHGAGRNVHRALGRPVEATVPADVLGRAAVQVAGLHERRATVALLPAGLCGPGARRRGVAGRAEVVAAIRSVEAVPSGYRLRKRRGAPGRGAGQRAGRRERAR